MRRAFVFGLLGASALVAASAAVADPPERVGRVGYIEGMVSLQSPRTDDWMQALVNFPVAEGEGFWTGDDGRAELQVGGVDASLDSETELDVTDLRWGDMRLALSQGSVNIRVRGNPEGGVTLATPAGDVHLDGRGFYRIDVAAPDEAGGDSAAEVTVFQGQAEAPGPAGYTPVGAGQAATLYAGYDPQFQQADDSAIDDWARERVRAEWAPRQNFYLPEGMSGASELARYGDYISTPEFGTVWFPRDVPPDWAPYRFGRWVNVAPWGYTWVDDAPWGFAPFHYGRWTLIDGRWGWIPGQPDQRPVYAPALVAFLGGDGWDVDGAGGAIGWIPLGPDEVYRPTYEVSEDYLRRANGADVRRERLETMVVRPDERRQAIPYRNATAATVVRADALARGAPVREAVVRVAPEVLARAPAGRPTLPPPPRAAAIARPSAPPPPRLRARRAAVAAPPSRPGAAPVIAGAPPPIPHPHAPPPPRPAGALIAPAQRHNPGAQHRQAVAPPPTAASPEPSARPTPPPTPAPRAPRHRPAPPAAPNATAPSPPENAAAPPSAVPPDAQAQAEAKAKAVARRQAKREAAQKAAAAAAANPPSPPPK